MSMLKPTLTMGMRGRDVTLAEARESVRRLVNSHFHNRDSARVTIPCSVHDDDIVATDYLCQQAMLDTEEARELRAIERGFAYLQASSVITSHCLFACSDGAMEFYDTRSADIDLTDEVKYLQSRRLLDLYPGKPHLVSVRDEGEPLPEGQGGY